MAQCTNSGCRASRSGESWRSCGSTPTGPPLALNVEQNVQGLTVDDEPPMALADDADGADDAELATAEQRDDSCGRSGGASFGFMSLAAASWSTVSPLAREMAHRLSPGCTT